MQPQIVQASTENRFFTLAFWTPSESDDELIQLWELVGGGEEVPRIKSPHRLREWLSSRILMQKIGITGLGFLPNGKPVLPVGAISMSHCNGSVAVVTSENAIGVDIQVPAEQIGVIRRKFCSASEWAWLEHHEESLRALTIVWSAKEAIFKHWGERVEFAVDIEVLPFRCDDMHVVARYSGVHGAREFRLWHTATSGMEIVVAI